MMIPMICRLYSVRQFGRFDYKFRKYSSETNLLITDHRMELLPWPERLQQHSKSFHPERWRLNPFRNLKIRYPDSTVGVAHFRRHHLRSIGQDRSDRLQR